MSFTNEVWLAIGAGADGSGTGVPGDPYITNTPTSFAAKMNLVPANTLIRFGAGTFRLRGGAGDGYVMDGPDAFVSQPGQKMIGSGMFGTKLQFVWDLG